MSTSIRCPITGFSCARSCLQRGAQCLPNPPGEPEAIVEKLDADQRRFVDRMVRYGKLGQPGYGTDQHGKATDQLGVTEMRGVYRYLTDVGQAVGRIIAQQNEMALALEQDRKKLEAMGADAGPTWGDLDDEIPF